MATNFPASLDALTNPTSSDSLSSPSHSAQHANVNDAVEALQAKVGADSSAVTSSLDYKVAQLEALGERVDYTGSATLGNVTIGNGTFTYAHYTRVNDLVVYMGEFVLGSTSAVTANVLIGLPIVSASGLYTTGGVGMFVDEGTQTYPCYARFANTTATGLFSYYAASTYAVQGNANATTPFTWAATDKILWNIIYQAA